MYTDTAAIAGAASRRNVVPRPPEAAPTPIAFLNRHLSAESSSRPLSSACDRSAANSWASCSKHARRRRETCSAAPVVSSSRESRSQSRALTSARCRSFAPAAASPASCCGEQRPGSAEGAAAGAAAGAEALEAEEPPKVSFAFVSSSCKGSASRQGRARLPPQDAREQEVSSWCNIEDTSAICPSLSRALLTPICSSLSTVLISNAIKISDPI
mmetsp:Transcript_92084/g.263860  ORF Transcript_92084/g.263860 Transcript_92084/m.263860 type:complete len:214 (-) Transcript_92084:1866-2507(-)